jgi:hypothetical protein
MISDEGHKNLKGEVLSEVQADKFGIWEVLWRANSLFPEALMSERVAVAESVIRELQAEGLVQVLQGDPWFGPDDELWPVADVAAILRNWSAWIPRGDSAFWLVAAHPV